VPLASLLPFEDPVLLDLLWKCLQWDPVKRISAEEALVHPWFQTIEPKKGPGYALYKKSKDLMTSPLRKADPLSKLLQTLRISAVKALRDRLNDWGRAAMARCMSNLRLNHGTEESNKAMKRLITTFKAHGESGAQSASLLTLRTIMRAWVKDVLMRAISTWQIQYRQGMSLLFLAQGINASRSAVKRGSHSRSPLILDREDKPATAEKITRGRRASQDRQDQTRRRRSPGLAPAEPEPAPGDVGPPGARPPGQLVGRWAPGGL